MDYTSVIRLMLLTKALKYQKLCEISIVKAQEALGRDMDIDEYRKLCSETEKAKLYDEFSHELKALADRIRAGEEDETETGG